MKIPYIKDVLLSFDQPFFFVYCPTLRTVPVSTAIVLHAHYPTIGASLNMTTHFLGAAMLYGVEHAQGVVGDALFDGG
jgi:hypothetical protein